jgi:hypothetical protein
VALQRLVIGLTFVSLALWLAVAALAVDRFDDAAAVLAVMGAVETVGGLMFWWRTRRPAPRVVSSSTAVYICDPERVYREMDTCEFPQMADDCPPGFAAMIYHLGHEAGAAAATARS